MNRFIFLTIVLLAAAAAFAQTPNVLKLTIKNEETKEPVAQAIVSVKDTEISVSTDEAGSAELRNIPRGERTIVVSSPGYETIELKILFLPDGATEKTVFLKVTNEVGEVTIASTRTGREIDAEPTRVEAIDAEEIDEKISMLPANVSMVLSESTGIQVQQTSAAANTQSVRIQGLDGRYTQILKDGFPAYGGFSGSLSILEIPPLDLKQVEIIKGPSATFYGGGAIAGVVNFISKEPEDEPRTSLIFNQTSALGTDFSAFRTQRNRRFGYTLLGSTNFQKEYDADADGFTELPRTRSFHVNPRLFFYVDENTRFTVGNSTAYQKRRGGDIFAVRQSFDGVHRYFEDNDSFRNVTTFNFERDFSDGGRLNAKQSLAFYDRRIETPGYLFKGRQFNSYTDVSYLKTVKSHTLVAGFNAVYDQFREAPDSPNPVKRDETRTTFGGYLQDGFEITSKLSLEAGLRLDLVRDYGAFLLPRVSVLYKFNDHLTSRAGFGFGYKTPSIFTEDAEILLFRDVRPIGNALEAERSRGGTFDVNYRNQIGEKFSINLNQMFFYTQIDDPLVLAPDANGTFRFANAAAPIKSKGFETNARVGYDLAKLFIGYTYTDARADYLPGNRFLPLLPKHRVNSALVFEKEEDFKGGVEAYYTGRQFLTDGSKTRSFAVFGVFAEKFFGKFSLFFNAENITDVRQGRYGTVVFPPPQNPTFAEIYTFVEGRIFNGGIKIRL
ncbi:MAG TPA: TonB-dependent receptor [Pyrinomonadaceae bacterium]|jgi:iron complex outermembrane receptor protein/outer membrane receptor for ferrienterochelin and colicins